MGTSGRDDVSGCPIKQDDGPSLGRAGRRQDCPRVTSGIPLPSTSWRGGGGRGEMARRRFRVPGGLPPWRFDSSRPHFQPWNGGVCWSIRGCGPDRSSVSSRKLVGERACSTARPRLGAPPLPVLVARQTPLPVAGKPDKLVATHNSPLIAGPRAFRKPCSVHRISHSERQSGSEQVSYRESDQYKAARWRSWNFAVIGRGRDGGRGGIGKLLRRRLALGQTWGVVIFIIGALSPVWIVPVLLVRAGRKMYRLRRLQCVHWVRHEGRAEPPLPGLRAATRQGDADRSGIGRAYSSSSKSNGALASSVTTRTTLQVADNRG